MQTSLRIEGANCPTCFNETLDDLARLEGVGAVHGSFAGPCIEVDHDGAALDAITRTIRNRLHGIEMYSNEVRMVPLEPALIPAACDHHQLVEPLADTSATPATSTRTAATHEP